MEEAKTIALIPLSDAAKMLKVSYLVARDMLLRGELEGEKRQDRWFVVATSIKVPEEPNHDI